MADMQIKPMELDSQVRSASLTDPRALGRLRGIEDPRARAEAVAGQLETIFFGMVVKAMRATVPEGGLPGRGLGGREYVQMLDQYVTQTCDPPRDPALHDALVNEILNGPGAALRALERLNDVANTELESTTQVFTKGEPDEASKQ